VSRDELPGSQGPLITHAVGCLVWWPLAALVCVVVFPGQGWFGIAAAGFGLLALRLVQLTWRTVVSRIVDTPAVMSADQSTDRAREPVQRPGISRTADGFHASYLT
jgi:hypothetical protein